MKNRLRLRPSKKNKVQQQVESFPVPNDTHVSQYLEEIEIAPGYVLNDPYNELEKKKVVDGAGLQVVLLPTICDVKLLPDGVRFIGENQACFLILNPALKKIDTLQAQDQLLEFRMKTISKIADLQKRSSVLMVIDEDGGILKLLEQQSYIKLDVALNEVYSPIKYFQPQMRAFLQLNKVSALTLPDTELEIMVHSIDVGINMDAEVPTSFARLQFSTIHGDYLKVDLPIQINPDQPETVMVKGLTKDSQKVSQRSPESNARQLQSLVKKFRENFLIPAIQGKDVSVKTEDFHLRVESPMFKLIASMNPDWKEMKQSLKITGGVYSASQDVLQLTTVNQDQQVIHLNIKVICPSFPGLRLLQEDGLTEEFLSVFSVDKELEMFFTNIENGKGEKESVIQNLSNKTN